MEPKLKRLWEVYEKAKSDYFAVSDSKSNDLVGAAKFLRDTAENTQQYLTDKSIDPIMLAELQSTYNMAKATVVSLTGGKKRKFDAVDMEWMRSAPRAPSGSEQNLNSWRPARSNQYPYPSRSSDSGYGAGTYSYRDNNNAADTDRGQSSKSEHRASRRRSSSPREYHGRSPRERSRDREHDRHRDRDREREASRDRDGRRYGSKRGHSGIPYGYRRDREVDSYQPRRYKDDLSD